MIDKEEYMSLGINLEGKMSIVTGAGRKIGRVVAVSLAKAGADIFDRKPIALNPAANATDNSLM